MTSYYLQKVVFYGTLFTVPRDVICAKFGSYPSPQSEVVVREWWPRTITGLKGAPVMEQKKIQMVAVYV